MFNRSEKRRAASDSTGGLVLLKLMDYFAAYTFVLLHLRTANNYDYFFRPSDEGYWDDGTLGEGRLQLLLHVKLLYPQTAVQLFLLSDSRDPKVAISSWISSSGSTSGTGGSVHVGSVGAELERLRIGGVFV